MNMGRKKKIAPSTPVVANEVTWLRATFQFPSTFSYRQAGASSQFAVGSPIPSPDAVKLALVDTAIRWSGDVGRGKEVFDWVKICPVYPVPPERVVRFRTFLSRLRKGKEGSFVTSTGVRDYFLLFGPLQVFLKVPRERGEEAISLLQRVRRFGTSDSLCWCCEVGEIGDGEVGRWRCFFPRRADELGEELLARGVAQGFLLVHLSDLTEGSEFDGFNPFGGKGGLAHRQRSHYLLPLVVERVGETWAVLRREPFSFLETV